ncbi:MAG TPA: class I SAM-dependent methyltransferase [Vicinamibacterales bacterium]|nr:class I SAM-dependent methyltransferase [Vicinamibacterales bacterium]
MWKHMDVQGFLMPNEAIALYDLAKNIGSASATLVEIGSWLGKSSIVMASAISRQRDSRLYCIDPFDGSGDVRSAIRYRQLQEAMRMPLLDQFQANIRNAGLAEYVIPIAGASHDAIRTWNQPIHLLFIDGAHSYEAVKRDYTDWSPFVVDGGYICFHDTYLEPPKGVEDYHKGPGQVVRENVLNSEAWVDQSLVDSLYVARKRRL